MSHIPDLAARIEKMTARIGDGISWVLPIIVGLQAGIVLARHGFGSNLLLTQDIVQYLFAALFLFGIVATLARNTHIRVDALSRHLTPKTRVLIDCAGYGVLLIPFSIALFIFSVPYFWASLAILEGARDPSGLHLVFMLKGVIPVFSVLIFLQSIASLLRSITALTGQIDGC